jgi:hypothetical protein
MVEIKDSEFYDLDHLLLRESKFATPEFQPSEEVTFYYMVNHMLVKRVNDNNGKGVSDR